MAAARVIAGRANQQQQQQAHSCSSRCRRLPCQMRCAASPVCQHEQRSAVAGRQARTKLDAACCAGSAHGLACVAQRTQHLRYRPAVQLVLLLPILRSATQRTSAPMRMGSSDTRAAARGAQAARGRATRCSGKPAEKPFPLPHGTLSHRLVRVFGLVVAVPAPKLLAATGGDEAHAAAVVGAPILPLAAVPAGNTARSEHAGQ